ncbi:MAG: SNF2-related protein [Phycisphaerales bacterium]
MVTVATGVVDPWPHQLRVYKRMLDNWPFRLLIADEVGLGKTIEAGLIIRHAWISGLAKRVLILTPAGVMRQWQAELYEKFNLLIPIYDNGKLIWPEHHGRVTDLEQKVDRTEWLQQPLVIASSHLMRCKDRQKDLETAEGWDLLVLDEAHHARGGAAARRRSGTEPPAEADAEDSGEGDVVVDVDGDADAGTPHRVVGPAERARPTGGLERGPIPGLLRGSSTRTRTRASCLTWPGCSV